MDITQTFYDNMASQYDKLFLDWNATTQEQASNQVELRHEPESTQTYGHDQAESIREARDLIWH